MTRSAPTPLRCAIYTRVSTDHGLEQDFNSLDAQREAAEAFIRSQAHEGWRLLPQSYDDGGFSGGSLERPALQRLLGEVEAGRIDIIVVYKVDRLTRSLTDFARLVERFDARGASFVSVTQAFNTTSSMGRLTLNVLLSFAQFEREVTGERIRDKIAASKRKGLWMGGPVPHGYRVEARKLVIDPQEAQTVRSIFTQYQELRSIPALQQALRLQGIRSRVRMRTAGTSIGGVPLTNGPLGHILRNRIYLGEINHRGNSYPGEHEAIVTTEQFAAVQAIMAANTVKRRSLRVTSQALLTGLLKDDRGHAMSPSHALKKGARYRYYVSQALLQGRKAEAGSRPRIAAEPIESIVLQHLRPLATMRPPADQQPPRSDAGLIEELVEQVVLGSSEISIRLRAEAGPAGQPRALSIPWTPPSATRRREVIAVAGLGEGRAAAPMKAENRQKLIRALAQARAWLAELTRGEAIDTAGIARREGCSERAVRMRLSLAFLAPDIVEAAIAGLLPRALGLTRLSDLPMDWAAQRRALGIRDTIAAN
ncbi:Site-specific DNA recombinase OS=Bosea thiooxidans OX=53254 GN=SAMN05660750_03387 PE=4 SV=1 [Bosea thiooxidans]|uniref:Site-specific DNA recombinase n=1 Tax=Bosea thiooxidans TaxID=53254 RepID=A0A1T5FN43_9HYPH|nr:recombinase family protein [Bosea thiooxidans]SKB97599.1 Site-specific DNA recombinase [Bosea thiooxidans]